MPNYPLWDQLNQLKEAEWVDLTHTFDPEIPRFSEFEKVKFPLFSQSKSTALRATLEYRHQYGTHIDAPIHFVENKRYLEELDLKELVLPLIVLDFSKKLQKMLILSSHVTI